jgi:predicted O-methyltransferase YrrM
VRTVFRREEGAMHPLRTVSKIIRHPDIAAIRLMLRARMAREPLSQALPALLTFISRCFDLDGPALHAEYVDGDFARWFQARRAALRQFPGPSRRGTTDDFGLEALYLLVRAARPREVVETGVLYGASSAHILAALARNGAGELRSVEIGGPAGEPAHDFFIPSELRGPWHLILGDSRRELPSLLDRLPAVDLFHHDSLHTFEHMTWEYTTVLPHLSAHGVLSTDDVLRPHSVRELFRPNAFPEFCRSHDLGWASFRNFGIACRGDHP